MTGYVPGQVSPKVPLPEGLGLWLEEEMAGQHPRCSGSHRGARLSSSSSEILLQSQKSWITWANDRTEAPAFWKEPVMGGQLSLPGGDPRVPLSASASRSGKDVSPKCQPQAGGLSWEAVFQDVSQSAELLL